MQEDRERTFAKKLYNDGTKLALGTRKMPPLSVGDKVLVQNQTGRAPNKWDKPGVIVECKPHNQVNVMMDGSRKVSLRNRQFVRKIEAPMAVVSPGVKPSQFYAPQHCDGADVQDRQGEDAGVVMQGDCGQMAECTEGIDATDASGEMMVDDQMNYQDRVEVGEGVADGAVGQQQPPALRSKRHRKPNSKYDPAVYDLESVQIRGIPLSGKENGWQGIYWPQ